MADVRLCSTVPMEHAITAALQGDRSHQVKFRAALKERADITISSLRAMPGVTCSEPKAAFYVMPKVALPPGKTDEEYVLALLRIQASRVHGSGFACRPRMATSASCSSHRPTSYAIYRLMATSLPVLAAG